MCVLYCEILISIYPKYCFSGYVTNNNVNNGVFLSNNVKCNNFLENKYLLTPKFERNPF